MNQIASINLQIDAGMIFRDAVTASFLPESKNHHHCEAPPFPEFMSLSFLFSAGSEKLDVTKFAPCHCIAGEFILCP